LGVSLLFSFTPPVVAADDVPSENITIEYRYTAGESVNIPANITQFGTSYRLVSRANPVLESTLPLVRTYGYLVNGTLLPKDLSLAEAYPNITLSPVEVSLERSVDKTSVLTGLPNNDVDYLPLSQQFQVSSATAADAISLEQLSRAGVTYAVESYDSDGLPSSYKATVVFRGVETYADLGYYTASATYTTQQVEGQIETYVIIATYEPIPPVNNGQQGNVTPTQPSEPTSPSQPTGPSQPVQPSAPDNNSNSTQPQPDDTTTTINEEEVPLFGGFAQDSLNLLLMVLLVVLLLIASFLLLFVFLLVKRKKRKRNQTLSHA
jgi:hypothetical protein